VLEPSETGAILDLATIMYQVQIDRVVLGALGLVFSRWTGQPFFHFEYSGHGRDPIVPDVDLSRTAGWFAARFPVFISLDQSAGVADWVAATARILGGVPHGGLGYGILRYLTNDRTAAEALRQLPQAQVGFNYQGDLDRLYARSSFFATEEWLPEGTGKRVVPATTWVQVMSNVHRRQLHVRFEYHESVYARATIQALSDHLKFALRSLAPTRRRAHGSSD
jgi:non-ribosomal peptide synthase protein (TIGR01720 family)